MNNNNETYEDLCHEIDDINRRWAEDNERHTDVIACQEEQIEKLETSLGDRTDDFEERSHEYDILSALYEKLKKENEKLKEKLEEHNEDLEDYKLFCDAFDVPYAQEAIDNFWNYLSDESKKELIKNGHHKSK